MSGGVCAKCGTPLAPDLSRQCACGLRPWNPVNLVLFAELVSVGVPPVEAAKHVREANAEGRRGS